jgi:hypothetical protein
LGHLRSAYYLSSLDGKGNPIPWISYPALEYLRQFDFSKLNIFEYGSGNSTLFWAENAKSVTSVENDRAWFVKIRNRTWRKNNVALHFAKQKGAYINKIAIPKRRYDIIIIDGIYRFDCAKKCLAYLSKNGMIILDNSELFAQIAKYLRRKGYFEIDFSGFAPINSFTQTTSLFYKNTPKLKPKYHTYPKTPVGGLSY